jgi:hypothetical protein
MQDLDSTEWVELSGSLEAASPRPRPLRAHAHAALLYWSPQEYLDTIVPFMADGVRAGDLVVHVSHGEPLPPLVAALREAGVDVEAAQAAGKLMLLTADQAFAPSGRFDLEESSTGIKAMIAAAQDSGAPQVRFAVDIGYVLSGTPGIDDFMVLDARANEDIFPTYPFICVCAYDAANGVNEMVEDMFLTHPLVFVRGIPMPNPHYQPWKQLSSHAAYLHRWKTRYGATARG